MDKYNQIIEGLKMALSVVEDVPPPDEVGQNFILATIAVKIEDGIRFFEHEKMREAKKEQYNAKV